MHQSIIDVCCLWITHSHSFLCLHPCHPSHPESPPHPSTLSESESFFKCSILLKVSSSPQCFLLLITVLIVCTAHLKFMSFLLPLCFMFMSYLPNQRIRSSRHLKPQPHHCPADSRSTILAHVPQATQIIPARGVVPWLWKSRCSPWTVGKDTLPYVQSAPRVCSTESKRGWSSKRISATLSLCVDIYVPFIF